MHHGSLADDPLKSPKKRAPFLHILALLPPCCPLNFGCTHLLRLRREWLRVAARNKLVRGIAKQAEVVSRLAIQKQVGCAGLFTKDAC